MTGTSSLSLSPAGFAARSSQSINLPGRFRSRIASERIRSHAGIHLINEMPGQFTIRLHRNLHVDSLFSQCEPDQRHIAHVIFRDKNVSIGHF